MTWILIRRGKYFLIAFSCNDLTAASYDSLLFTWRKIGDSPWCVFGTPQSLSHPLLWVEFLHVIKWNTNSLTSITVFLLYFFSLENLRRLLVRTEMSGIQELSLTVVFHSMKLTQNLWKNKEEKWVKCFPLTSDHVIILDLFCFKGLWCKQRKANKKLQRHTGRWRNISKGM